MRIKSTSILLLLLITMLTAEAGGISGLRFKSKEVEKEHRTGIDITHKAPFNFRESINIEFDISFRKGEDKFGYIFRLKDEKSLHSFDLVAKLEGSNPSIFLVANKSIALAELPVSNTLLKEINRWHTISFGINTSSGKIILKGLGSEITVDYQPIKPTPFRLLFGTSPDGWWLADETPPMSVRNISVTTDGSEPYFWPLHKTDSKEVKDENRHKKASIINPDWVEDMHSHWQPVMEMKFTQPPLITWNEQNECFVIVKNNGTILQYFPGDSHIDTLQWSGGKYVMEEIHQLLADSSGIISYSLNYPAISKYDEATQSWSYSREISGGLPRYWHHNKLIHPITGSITTIAGYGFYTYHNTIQSFNQSNRQWEQLHFTGDTIYPRYLSAFGLSQVTPNQGFLFGGMGNRSGKQILGKEYFYDLYLIDFKSQNISKIWQLPTRPETNYTPSNALIIDDNDNYFYTLIYLHQKQKTVIRTIRGSLHNPYIEVVANDIPFNFVDVTSFTSIYRWNSANKLLALTLEENGASYHLKIYSILNPPASETAISGSTSSNTVGWILITTSLIASCISIFRYKKKSKKQLQQTVPPTIEPQQAHITILGNFEVRNSSGNDISHLFTPTVKELFMLILLHQYENNKGITSAAIQEALWSDKEDASAKNNRGVNIKKLRDVLSELGSSTVIYDNVAWNIEFDSKIVCDYIFVKDVISEFNINQQADKEALNHALHYLQQGILANDTKAEWIDNFKDSFTGEVAHFLESQLSICNSTDDAQLILEICTTLSIYDRLNEKALAARCRTLSKTGRNTLALEAYESFYRQYHKSYGEDYKISFQQLIKQKT